MIILIILIVILVLGIYFYNFHNGFAVDILHNNELVKDSHAIFGQFGDYLGGILNPILTSINIFILIYFNNKIIGFSHQQIARMDQQIKSMSDQIKEAEKQNRMNEDKDQVFKLLDNQNNTLQQIEKNTKVGINAFREIMDELTDAITVEMSSLDHRQDKETDIIKMQYSKYYKNEGVIYLGHYFENLLFVYDFIMKQSDFLADEKETYSKMVTCQISLLERQLIFLHCLSIDQGDITQRLKTYAKKNGLFDGLDKLYRTEIYIKKIINNQTWYKSN